MHAFLTRGISDAINRDRVVQLCPPARPYIKNSFEGILMYELAGDYINKFCNYADPTIEFIFVHIFRRDDKTPANTICFYDLAESCREK